jgi:hypothetical protein
MRLHLILGTDTRGLIFGFHGPIKPTVDALGHSWVALLTRQPITESMTPSHGRSVRHRDISDTVAPRQQASEVTPSEAAETAGFDTNRRALSSEQWRSGISARTAR